MLKLHSCPGCTLCDTNRMLWARARSGVCDSTTGIKLWARARSGVCDSTTGIKLWARAQ